VGKLVYIDSKSHTRGIPYGEKEVPPFYVLSKIQVIFQVLLFADTYQNG